MFAGTAIAQDTSSITGVVTDASTGKPVVGAVVVVTGPAIQAEQTVVTEAGGKFTVPNLPRGDYTLAVQMDGYKPFERADLKLKEATTLRANASVVPEAVQMEEVVVTGSRIRRKDLTTPAPVTVLNREAVQASGKVSIGDFLQSPARAGQRHQHRREQRRRRRQPASTSAASASQRTLVLVNGRRMVPGGTGADSSVDLNTIPTAAIERVEVLKDGASAIYGSDAIGGVVNIITRKNFNGAELSYYTGVSQPRRRAGQRRGRHRRHGQRLRQRHLLARLLRRRRRPWPATGSFSQIQYFFDSTGENYGRVGENPPGSSRVPGGRVSQGGSGNAAFNAIKAADGLSAGQYLIHDSTLTAADPGVAACLGSGALNGAGDPVTLADCQWRKMNTNATAGKGGDLYNFALANYLITPPGGTRSTRRVTGSSATTSAPSTRRST